MINDYDGNAKKRQNEIINKTNRAQCYVEKPMMKSMMLDLKDKKTLMIGCGTGEETKLLEEYNAKNIVGIDISKNSIEIAQKTYPDHKFIIADMHNLPFEDNTFDFIYSSLAIHYSDNPEKVYMEVNRVLKKDGCFLFSVGHPLRWTSDKVIIDNNEYKLLGYQNSSTENKIYGKYNSFTKIEEYLACEDMTFSLYINSPSTVFKLLKKCGFIVEDFSESKCVDELKKIDYNYWYRYHEFPQFMAFLAKKIKGVDLDE